MVITRQGSGAEARRARRRRLGLTLALVVAATGAHADEVLSRSVLLMGTWLDIEVLAVDEATALTASAAGVEAVERAERRLSTWISGSELTTVNRAPAGAWQPVSDALERDLRDAVECARRTGGAFSPAIGALVEAWNLRGGGRIPDESELERVLADCSIDDLGARNGEVRRARPGLTVEEGGFGKGAALRDGTRAALAAGAACAVLDLGGQVAVAGRCGQTRVDVSDPDDRSRTVAALQLERGSVATSGGSERSIVVGGVRFHHVLDPRTGLPARDWGSVTVITDDAVWADCLATALVVLGPDAAMDWARDEPSVEVVIARRETNGVRISATAGLNGRLEVASGVGLEWFGMARGSEPR